MRAKTRYTVMALSVLAALQASSAGVDIWGTGEVPALSSAEDVPRTLDALWSGYEAHYDKDNPLEVDILKTWEEDGIVCMVVRFTVGTFRGEKAKLAGFYAYPKGGTKLPAVVQTNGGGQRAGLFGPLKWARAGYACFNPNNGAQPWGGSDKDLPNTDWGALRPGLPGDKRDGKGMLAPGSYTIDAVDSPRNHQWFPRVIGARRAITFLQSRPEVDPARIGIRGHSTGGVMTVFESIDPRVKAAVPSVGGCGFWFGDWKYVMGNNRGTGGADEAQLRLFMNTMACDAHWKTMHAPVFFLGASNDFNSPTENVWAALSALPDAAKRGWVLAPHYNHAFNVSAGITDILWFEDHLKGSFDFPRMPRTELDLSSPDGVPLLRVWPDPATKFPIHKLMIYYSYERQPMMRFWTDAHARKVGDHWEGSCSVFDVDEPLFAFANVTYEINHTVFGGSESFTVPLLMVTSEYNSATPGAMQAAGVRSTATRERVIEEFEGELVDWIGELEKPREWSIETRKIIDPRWMGPRGAHLVLDVNTPAPGNWIGVYMARRFRSANSGACHYYAFYELAGAGWNTVRMKPADFTNVYGEALDGWSKVTVLRIGDAADMANDKKRFLPRAGKQSVAAIPSEVSGWKSSYYQSTNDTYAKDNIMKDTAGNATGRLRNLRWEGGSYEGLTKPWQDDETR